MGWLIVGLLLTGLLVQCHGQAAQGQSEAPSDVPSRVPVSSDAQSWVPSSVPTVTVTPPPRAPVTEAPTAIPICPNEWTAYRTCFSDELDVSVAMSCDNCVQKSLPRPGPESTCEDYSNSICGALTGGCECSVCSDDIERYYRCVFEELNVGCDLDCGTIVAPSDAPSSVPPGDAAIGMSTSAPSRMVDRPTSEARFGQVRTGMVVLTVSILALLL